MAKAGGLAKILYIYFAECELQGNKHLREGRRFFYIPRYRTRLQGAIQFGRKIHKMGKIGDASGDTKGDTRSLYKSA